MHFHCARHGVKFQNVLQWKFFSFFSSQFRLTMACAWNVSLSRGFMAFCVCTVYMLSVNFDKRIMNIAQFFINTVACQRKVKLKALHPRLNDSIYEDGQLKYLMHAYLNCYLPPYNQLKHFLDSWKINFFEFDRRPSLARRWIT